MRSRVGISVVILVLALPNVNCPKPAFAQEKAADDKGRQAGAVRQEVDLVSIYFTVRDKNKRLANDLRQDKFNVSEDGRPQAIKFFAHHSDVLLNAGVLLDTGTNMSWILNKEAQAAALFVKHVVRPTDLGFILGYASRVETVQVPTSDIVLLEEKAETIQTGAAIGLPDQGPGAPRSVWFPGGGTVGTNGKPFNKNREAHLYDAVRVSAHRYLSGEIGRKAVVIVALSGDSQSESTMEDARQALLETDVIAYVLQIYDAGGDRCDVLHIFEKDTLKKLAEETGGRMLEVRGLDKLEPALDEIADELHHQYSLGYYPENKNWDSKFRKIQISTAEKGYKISARKGYYANRPAGNLAAEQ
jgi:VWFA-related protein